MAKPIRGHDDDTQPYSDLDFVDPNKCPEAFLLLDAKASPQALVSVLMPSFNQAPFIEAAIASVLSQDYPHLELIVADGGSDDGTVELLRAIQRDDDRLRWFSEKDQGPAHALNKASKRVRGILVGWLNSDDIYAPGAVMRAVAALEANPTWMMVYGQGEHIDSQGRSLDPYPTRPPSAGAEAFSAGCFICQPTVFFRRTMALLLGAFDESLKTAFDFEYWLRAFKHFPDRIGFLDELQARSRLHADCITLRMRRSVAVEGMAVLARYFGTAPTHWLLTYADELIAGRQQEKHGRSLRPSLNAMLAEAKAYLKPFDEVRLRDSWGKDPRFDAVEIRSPPQNAELAMQEFHDGIVEVSSTPHMLTLETSSRCNLRCVMCPQAIGAVDRPKHLDDACIGALNRFIKQAKSIQLHGIGEPTASPAFWSTLDFLPPPDVCESSINTNLTLMDDERLDRLLRSNLKIVNVSLDAASKETYEKIRGFDFGVVLDNLRKLLAGRALKKQKLPLVYLNMTLMRSNVEEVQSFIRLAADLRVDMVVLWHLNRWSDEEMARYVVPRGDWVFDYSREGLWNYKELSNQCLAEAEVLARELGVKLYLDQNKTVYFEP